MAAADENVTAFFECLDPVGCDMHYDFQGSCAFVMTSEAAILAGFGIFLNALLVLGGVVLLVANLWLKIKVKKLILTILVCSLLLGVFGVVFWTTVFLQTDTDAFAVNFRTLIYAGATAMQVMLMLAVLIQLALSYQWVSAVERRKGSTTPALLRMRIVLVVVAFVILLLFGAALGVIYWPLESSSADLALYFVAQKNRKTVSLSISTANFVIQLVVAVIFIVYAVQIVRSEQRQSKTLRNSIRVLVVLLTLAVLVLASIVVGLSFAMMDSSRSAVGLKYIPTGAVVPETLTGVLLFLFFYLLPLTVPYLLILWIIASGFRESKMLKRDALAPKFESLSDGSKAIPILSDQDEGQHWMDDDKYHL